MRSLPLLIASHLVSTFALAAPLTLNTPESVYHDTESGLTFVSNVAGNPGERDGNGFVATVAYDRKGALQVTKLVDGLDAPKGLIAKNGVLYVTDIDRVVEIDLKTREILATIPVPGATFLNDPALADDGTLYVSDMIASRIYGVKDGRAFLFAEGQDLESPNGLLVKDGKLYVAAWGFITDPAIFGVQTVGHLYAIDLKTKQKELVSKAPLGNLDGLVALPNGDFVVTDWVAGTVIRVAADGTTTLLARGFANPADLGLKGDLLLVPEMGANRVTPVALTAHAE